AGANRNFGGVGPDALHAARNALAYREPGWYYGSVLPFRARAQEKEWAIPGILRDAAWGSSIWRWVARRRRPMALRSCRPMRPWLCWVSPEGHERLPPAAQGCMILRQRRFGPSRPIIQLERRPMPQDASPPTSKDDP